MTVEKAPEMGLAWSGGEEMRRRRDPASSSGFPVPGSPYNAPRQLQSYLQSLHSTVFHQLLKQVPANFSSIAVSVYCTGGVDNLFTVETPMMGKKWAKNYTK